MGKGKERLFMPNIKPISDLRNYTEVLKEATEGSPVFLTKNGRGEYVILNMAEYDRMKAMLALKLKRNWGYDGTKIYAKGEGGPTECEVFRPGSLRQ